MYRWDIINKFIEARGFKSYLEIGVFKGDNIRRVKAKHKVGVDPDLKSPATVHMASDEFFEQLPETELFDIVFIDGLHLCDQVWKDIQNSLQHLSSGGVIVLHDMLPTSEHLQSRKRLGNAWNGDCWKALVRCRKELPFKCYTIDEDYGCGVVDTSRKSDAKKKKLPEGMLELTWQQFCDNKQEWMDVIPASSVCWEAEQESALKRGLSKILDIFK